MNQLTTYDGCYFPDATAGAEAFAIGVDDQAGKKLYFHSLDGQFGFWDQEKLNPPP